MSERIDDAEAAPEPGGIRIQDVTHSYRSASGDDVLALDDVDLTIPEGEFLCLVGPSGCGKSTLLNMVGGFLAPSSGRVLRGGRPVTGPTADVGVVFQSAPLFPWLTVRQNVELGPRYRRLPREERRRLADEHLEMVGLSDFLDARPYELSGGMRQRCQIARVLANEPQVILMDEPFGALDTITRERLQLDLLRIHQARRTTVLFITHSVDEAVLLGDRVVVMSPRPGRIVLDTEVPFARHRDAGEARDLRSQPEFIALRDEIAGAIQAS